MLWSAQYGPDGRGGIGTHFTTTGLQFILGNSCSDRFPSQWHDIVVPKAEFTAGRWYHIVAIYEADRSMRVYVDGMLRMEHAAPTCDIPAEYVAVQQFLGTDPRPGNNGLYYNLDGDLDDLQLFSRALSAAEIAA